MGSQGVFAYSDGVILVNLRVFGVFFEGFIAFYMIFFFFFIFMLFLYSCV
jgi:hypothetical protein